MSTAKAGKKPRERGEIEELPSGSLRVKVYAGVDPLSGRRHYLTETIPPGKNARKTAEKARTRFINQVDEQRNPKTKANVNRLMDRYLELLDVGTNTRKSYTGYINNHVRPLLGELQVGRLDGEILDSFYATLRRCRAHCDGTPYIQHRVKRDHTCTEKCRPHKCKGLATSSIRQVHWCLSGALKRAVRWHWISVNPLDQAESPKAVRPNPNPPTPAQAAEIINKSFNDLSWGVMIWVAMVTGVRRGELCALRWDFLDLDAAVLSIKTSIGQDGKTTWEKDTKTHQQRRIALDAATVTLLRAYRRKCDETAAELGRQVRVDGRIFSPNVDHGTWHKPDSVSQRYRRMCAKLGWDMSVQELRHYSATELISSGADVRTVAGRLGHGGGGSTTLRVYSAWVSEADQRAAGNLSARMPDLPIGITQDKTGTETIEAEVDSPYQKIAADLRGAISCGALRAGDSLPTVKELANRYDVVISTAHRAIAELKSEKLVVASRGRRTVVADPTKPSDSGAEVVELRPKRA